jgi:hypothetical protein
MLPRRIHGTTHTFTAPKDWDETRSGKCRPLHVRVIPQEGGALVQSAWEPTPEELRMLNAGGSIVLTLIGAQPPVNLEVHPPVVFEDVKG